MVTFSLKTVILVAILFVCVGDFVDLDAKSVDTPLSKENASPDRGRPQQKTVSSFDSALFTSSRMNYFPITLDTHDSYSDFYAHQPSNVPGASNEDIRRYNEELEYRLQADDQGIFKQNRETGQEQPESQVHLLDRLWNAVRKGYLRNPHPQTSFIAPSLKAQVSSLLFSGSVVEIGSGMTVLNLAPLNQNRTYMAVTTQGHITEVLSEEITKKAINNLYVGHMTPGDLVRQVDLLYSDHQVLFPNLLLTNISSLVGVLLPHEFEEFVARLLALSVNTVVANLIDVDDIQAAYFKDNWESLSTFLQKACHIAQLACEIHSGHGDKWNDKSSVVQVMVNRGTRMLPHKLCSSITSQTQCWLVYGMDYSRPMIMFRDGSSLVAPVTRNAFSMDLLCKLGCSQSTQEHFFHHSLMLPYSPHFTSRSLVVTGSQVTLQLNKATQAPIELMEDTSDVQKISSVTQEQNFTKRTTMSPPLKNTLDTSLVSMATEKATSSNSLPKLSVVRELPLRSRSQRGHKELSQLEGVVQQLERVDGDGEHVGLVHDQRQAEHLSRHWDREHNVADPVRAQEQAVLRNLNKAWEREKPQESYPDTRTSITTTTHKMNKLRQESRAGNSDAVLRKDEKDLRQAMGFLHGNSNVRDMIAHMSQNIDNLPMKDTRHKPLQYKRHKPVEFIQSQLEEDDYKQKNHQKDVKHDDNAEKHGALEIQPKEHQPGSSDATISVVIRQNNKKVVDGSNPDTADDTMEKNEYGAYDDDGDDNVYTYDEAAEEEAEAEEMEDIIQGIAPLEEVELSMDADMGEGDEKHEAGVGDEYQIKVPPATPSSPNANDKDNRNLAVGEVSDDRYLDKMGNFYDDTNVVEYASDKQIHHLQDILSDLDMDERHHQKHESLQMIHEKPKRDGQSNHARSAERVRITKDFSKLPSSLVPHNPEKSVNEDLSQDSELGFKSLQDGRGKARFGDIWQSHGKAVSSQRPLATVSSHSDSPPSPLDGQPVTPSAQKSETLPPHQKSRSVKLRHLLAESLPDQEERDAMVQSDSSERRPLYKQIPKKTLSDVMTGKTADNPSQADSTVQQHDEQITAESQGPRSLPSLFGPLVADERIYDQQWLQLQSEFQQAPANFSILIHGSLRHGLLGLKLARTHPHANILTILPTSHQLTTLSHLRKMRGSMRIENNMILACDLDVLTVHRLYELPQFTHYQILGIGLYDSLLRLGSGFLLHLGKLLTLAQTTYLEVPDPRQLRLIYSLLTKYTPTSERTLTLKGLIYQSLYEVGVDEADVTVLQDPPDTHHILTPLKLVKITIASLKRRIRTNCDASMATMKIAPTGSIMLAHEERHEVTPFLPVSRISFNLQTLLHLGLLDLLSEKSHVFLSYLDLPLHDDMCPVHLSWYQGTLFYCPPSGCALTQPIGKNAHQQPRTKDLIKTLLQEVEDQPFSLMDYGSWEGAAVISLALKFPNSTFIALVDKDAHQAAQLYTQLSEDQIENVIVANLSLTDNFTIKLLESPDFLRYQLLDQSGFIHLLTKLERRTQLDYMLGQMIATGVTTFIQLPSDQMLSMAMSTFFPTNFHGTSTSNTSNYKWHLTQEHPLSLYKDAVKKLIGQSAKAHVNIKVHSEVIPASVPSPDILPSSNILRIDVESLNTTVDHHFDYQLDGHSRKYTLHCESANKTHYEVHLIRQKDGFHIPYGRVEVISLIALLRMGILEPLKAKLYDKFLQLPYYEDMAPWNIVFQAGNLRYIDYDTKDHNFNQMVPAAFQVMAMLLNYQRTVLDFGHCGSDARILYGLTLVGKCVGGEFQGPCEDTKFPVPCGDYTCRTTYVECLQVLNQLEHKKSFHQGDILIGNDTKKQSNQQIDDDLWNFGHGTRKL